MYYPPQQQYPMQQHPAPPHSAPNSPVPYPQQSSFSASLFAQQSIQYMPDWSYTDALLQAQSENDRLRRQLDRKTLREEELTKLFTMQGNAYFSVMGSGRVVQLTCFLFERVEEIAFNPLYRRKSQVRFKLTNQAETGQIDWDDFLNDKKFLLFLERLSRSRINVYGSAKQVSILLRSIAMEKIIRVYFPYFGGWLESEGSLHYYTFHGFRTNARLDWPEQYEKIHAELPVNARTAAENFVYRLSPIQNRPLRAFCTIWLHMEFLPSILLRYGVHLSQIPTIFAENPVVQAYLRAVFSLRPDSALSMRVMPLSFSMALTSCKDQPCVLVSTAHTRNSVNNENTLREALATGKIQVLDGKQKYLPYPFRALPILLSDDISGLLGSDCGIPISTTVDDFDLSACAKISADGSSQETYWSAFVAFVAMHLDELSDNLRDHMRLALEESAIHEYTSEHAAVLGAMSWVAQLIRLFYHELSIENDGILDDVWKGFLIDALEEGAAQYAAPYGLADTFIGAARDAIRLKQIPCYRITQCFETVPRGAVYYDSEHICFDRLAFEQVCQVSGCNPVAVKREFSESGYFLGKVINHQSYETRISLRFKDGRRHTARVYKFERAHFDLFGEPTLFERRNGQ